MLHAAVLLDLAIAAMMVGEEQAVPGDDFSKAHATMGEKLRDALKQYDAVSAKIDESGQSILTSARQLIKLGVPKNPKKPLPEGEADN